MIEPFENVQEHDPGGKLMFMLPPHVISDAVYSPCKQYRYELHRRWETGKDRSILFLMMNPSTATASYDDPTVRKCRGYAERWGYNHLIVANIMAYRATHPKMLLEVDDPIGPENYITIHKLISDYKPMVVCAWGRIPKKLGYAENKIIEILRVLGCETHVLRLNISNRPWHPLYLPNDTMPMIWPLP